MTITSICSAAGWPGVFRASPKLAILAGRVREKSRGFFTSERAPLSKKRGFCFAEREDVLFLPGWLGGVPNY
jgi:hypothetical protein